MKTELAQTHIDVIKKANQEIDAVLLQKDKLADYLNTVNDLEPGEGILVSRKKWKHEADKKKTWTYKREFKYFVSLGITRFGNIKLIVANDKDLKFRTTYYKGQWEKISRISTEDEIVP